MAPLVYSGGNTKPPRKERVTASMLWCFTLNNWCEEEFVYLATFCKENSNEEYVIGKEVGEMGTPHLQGFIKFTSKVRPLEKCANKRIHWEKCKGSLSDNVKYCTKENNFLKGKNIKVERPLKLITELYAWQQEIVDIISTEPDDRTIYWFYDSIGNCGKTQLTKYLCAKHGAMLVDGKKNDILYGCCEMETDCYIFNFSRSVEDYVSYDSIEKLKDGLYYSSKYESKMIIRNSPHILIFANFLPDMAKLSMDRWHCVNVGGHNPLRDLSPDECLRDSSTLDA